MTVPEPVLEIRNLSKTFPGQKALSDVSFDVLPGEVHALVGENGSGKSTLIKCLAGFYSPDPGGEIVVAGKELHPPYSTSDAASAGFCFVHQDLALTPNLSIMENLALSRGFETGAFGRVRWRAQARKARELLALFGEHLDPRTEVGRLSQADKTLVAIVRALGDSQEAGRVLVLDEPTAALPAHEAEVLFAAIRKVAASGMGIIYVSHRLSEVFEVADRLTVLRDAQKVGTYQVTELDERKLIELIVGKPLDQYYASVEETAAEEEVLLRVEDLTVNQLQGVSFDLHRGEILGIAGLLGSGRSELARALFGAQRRVRGEIVFKGEPQALESPAQAVEAGIALIPQDRRNQGSHPDLALRENMMLVKLGGYMRAGRLRRSAERRDARQLIDRFQVRPPDPERRFATLSGGNQQKAIVAKWMRLNPSLIIFDEPGQGVDIGSRTEIYRLIAEAAKEGMGVIVIDSDLEDLCRLCTRILVLRDGQIIDELTQEQRTRGRILERIYTEVEA